MLEYFLSKDVLVFHLTILNNEWRKRRKYATYNKWLQEIFHCVNIKCIMINFPSLYIQKIFGCTLLKKPSNVTTSLHKASLRIRRRSCYGLLLNIWCENVVEPIGLDLALVNKGENACMTIHVALTADVSLHNKDIEDIWRERLVELAKWFRWSLLWMVLLEVWQKIWKFRCSN